MMGQEDTPAVSLTLDVLAPLAIFGKEREWENAQGQ